MHCTNPDCPGGAISYPSPDDSMPDIPITCEGCGQTWYEPNEMFIERELEDRRNDYYDRF